MFLSCLMFYLESSLCAQWVAKDLRFLHADSEDSGRTGRMPRPADLSLRWAHSHIVGFVMSRLILYYISRIMSPPVGLGDIVFALVVCTSVRPSVCHKIVSAL